ncbi:MAG TPA: Tex-like N-terminal domain-containing protein, partial [Candidatus Xenobia bacterium]
MIDTIAAEVGRPKDRVSAVLKLFEEGATVPFIARYRKEVTGAMDEDLLRTIQARAESLQELAERKTAVLKSIAEQDKLTPDLERAIGAASTLQAVEDLYLPYRPKRRTRAMMAREKGLEPLAILLQEQRPTQVSLEELAAPFTSPDLAVADALAGAGDIIAETLSTTADLRAWLRQHVTRHAVYVSSVTARWREQKSKFEAYYDYRKPARDIAGHALLALRRGEQEEVLSVKLE